MTHQFDVSVCVRDCERETRPRRAGGRAGPGVGRDDGEMRARAGAGCPRTSLQPRAQHAPARRDTVLERPRHYTNDWGWGVTLIQDREHGRTCTSDRQRQTTARRGGRIRPCVLSWKYTRLRPRADRLSGVATRHSGRTRRSASRAVCVHACWVCQCVVTPLLPRMKASPYLALSWPFTYSSVCSIAMFMKPSRHASTPVPQLASSAYA